MRLIDADALIPTQVHTVVVLKDGREQLESVLYAEQVDDAPTVEPDSPWHRVEERLPEPYFQCLVRDNDNNCAVGYYRQDIKAWDSPFFGWLERDGEYYNDGDLCRIGKVVAWMPIEPPGEDE